MYLILFLHMTRISEVNTNSHLVKGENTNRYRSYNTVFNEADSCSYKPRVTDSCGAMFLRVTINLHKGLQHKTDLFFISLFLTHQPGLCPRGENPQDLCR
ncbi:hypothetical protein FKM82_031242 [Ascaphus truei]